MIKALHVLYSGLGGHASVAFAIVEGDVERRWRHTLLFYGIEAVPSSYRAKCEAIGAHALAVLKRPGPDAHAVAALLRDVVRCRPDVVIVHSASALPLVLAYRQLHRRSRVFYVEHHPNQLKSRQEWAASVAAMTLADRVVTLTEAHEAELRGKLGPAFSLKRVRRIPNALDLRCFSPRTGGAPAGPVTLAMQARFAPTRDHALLVRAFAECTRSTTTPLRLVLAGDGTTLPAVRSLTRSESLESIVELPGMLGEDAVVELLRRTTIYVHASNHETMSTAVMQAMACGLPCILADTPAMRALVGPEHNAMLYQPGSAPDLVRCLRILLENDDRRQKLGAAARRHAEQNWSHELQFKRYLALLQETAGPNR